MQMRAVRTEGVYQTESLKDSNILALYITGWLILFLYVVESELVPLGKGLEKEKNYSSQAILNSSVGSTLQELPWCSCPRVPSPTPMLLLPLVCHSPSQMCIKWMSAVIPSQLRVNNCHRNPQGKKTTKHPKQK